MENAKKVIGQKIRRRKSEKRKEKIRNLLTNIKEYEKTDSKSAGIYYNALMIGKNKEVPLRTREENIKRLIETDGRYQEAYRMVRFYYAMNYKMGKSYHYVVFQTIYEAGIKELQWKLAHECNMSRTTLFDYRNEIVKCFEICLEEVKEIFDESGIKEIAVTESIQEKRK